MVRTKTQKIVKPWSFIVLKRLYRAVTPASVRGGKYSNDTKGFPVSITAAIFSEILEVGASPVPAILLAVLLDGGCPRARFIRHQLSYVVRV
jgi:hypothetical protein